MTGIEKEIVHQMRLEGNSHSQIASSLGISINTIKSYGYVKHKWEKPIALRGILLWIPLNAIKTERLLCFGLIQDIIKIRDNLADKNHSSCFIFFEQCHFIGITHVGNIK